MTTHTTRPLRRTALSFVLTLGLAAVAAQELDPIQMLPVSEINLSPTLGIPSTAYGLNDIGTIVGSAALLPPDNPYRFGFLLSPLTGLRNLGWGEDVLAFGVNNQDEAVGTRGQGYGSAMLWTPEDDPEAPRPGRAIAVGAAFAINDATTVVGVHWAPTGPTPISHAFQWSPGSGLQDVESLSGLVPPWYYFAPLAEAHAIRNDGVMGGLRGGRAVIWQPTGELQELSGGTVMAISDAGLAVGGTSVAFPGSSVDYGEPLAWRDGIAIPISDQPGTAFDVNEAGYVVGRITLNGARHAFVWHETMGLRDLGPGAAYAIDEAGRIVGQRTIDQKTMATVWRMELPIEHLFVGLDTVAWRLIDPETKGGVDSHVGRAIAGARDDWATGQVNHATVRLQQVIHAVDTLERAFELAPIRASAIREIASELVGRLTAVQ